MSSSLQLYEPKNNYMSQKIIICEHFQLYERKLIICKQNLIRVIVMLFLTILQKKVDKIFCHNFFVNFLAEKLIVMFFDKQTVKQRDNLSVARFWRYVRSDKTEVTI